MHLRTYHARFSASIIGSPLHAVRTALVSHVCATTTKGDSPLEEMLELVLGRLIDSSINNRLSVMFSDYRFVRSVIDESNCFWACASISLSIQYIHHYFFLISKTGILQCKTAQVLRDGYGEYLHGQRPS